MKATIFFHDVPTQGENLVEIEFTAEPVWAAAAPAQPAGELRLTAEQICKADRRTGSEHMMNHQSWGEMMAEQLNEVLATAALGRKGE